MIMVGHSFPERVRLQSPRPHEEYDSTVPTPLFQQPGTKTAFVAVCVLFAAGEFVMRARSRLISRGGAAVERWSLLVVLVTIGGGVLLAIVLALRHIAEVTVGRWPLFVLGLVTIAAGAFIRQWAIFVLGRFFTVDVRVRPGQTVVDRGPYRWVRHPAYSGLLLCCIGIGLALGSWASLVVLATLPTLGLVLRIRSEERALLAALGEPYRRFAAGRSRLFPGVW